MKFWPLIIIISTRRALDASCAPWHWHHALCCYISPFFEQTCRLVILAWGGGDGAGGDHFLILFSVLFRDTLPCLFIWLFSFKLKTIATFSYVVWGHIYLFFFFFIKISWMLWALLSDTLPGTHYFCLHDFFFFLLKTVAKFSYLVWGHIYLFSSSLKSLGCRELYNNKTSSSLANWSTTFHASILTCHWNVVIVTRICLFFATSAQLKVKISSSVGSKQSPMT